MKDFLTDRPQSRSIRPVHSNEPQPSHFPPISSSSSLEVPSPPTVEQSSFEEPVANPIETPPCSNQEPLVEAVPDAQGRIGHIVVTCRCGEQTIVQCNY
jgi:hypothetical protein